MFYLLHMQATQLLTISFADISGRQNSTAAQAVLQTYQEGRIAQQQAVLHWKSSCFEQANGADGTVKLLLIVTDCTLLLWYDWNSV